MVEGRNRLILSAVCVIAGVLAVAYYFIDPSKAVWIPKCLWKAATGTDCPGCGSQRMAHALMHGDFAGAWHANGFALCLLPVLAFLVWLEFYRKRYPRLYMRIFRPWLIYAAMIAILAWWILRNMI